MKSRISSPNDIFQKIISNAKYKFVCRTDIYDFPRPYYKNIKDVKAIILGADPSNPQDKTFEFVFGLEHGEKSPYFNKILTNISNVELNLNNIYVQNICKNYFTDVTDKNDLFSEITEKYWLPYLKYELDSFFSKEIPVLVTAWKVLEIIAPEAGQYKKSRKLIYDNGIVFNSPVLSRSVFALFRGGVNFYNLSNPAFNAYLNKFKDFLE